MGRLQDTLGAIWRARLALSAVLVFVPMVLAPPLNHDVAAILSFSQRWLAGARLYVDLIDVNPPLIFMLTLLPAALADLTGIDPVMTLHLALFGLAAIIWALSLQVRDRPAEPPILRGLLDVLPGLIAFAAGYDFGQRETLMAAAALPYLLAAARREQGQRPPGGLAAALLATVFFALKPHFLAIPAAVELLVLLARVRRNGWRAAPADPTPWAMAALLTSYAGIVVLAFPAYLRVVVPLAWELYLDQGGLSPLGVLLVPRLATVLLLLAPLLVLVLRSAGPTGSLARMLAVAALGAVASAMAQHKGWTYHIAPVELFTVALACVLGAQWLDRAAELPGGCRAASGLLALLFALYAVEAGEAPWNQLGYHASDAAHLTDLLRSSGAAGQPVLVLSPGIAPIYPALNYAGARMTLPTMNMWLLEGAYRVCRPGTDRYRPAALMGAAERLLFDRVAEDFARTPPAAVVVDRIPGIAYCGSEFDFIAYFSRHPLFAATWAGYRPAGEWGRYRVFARKG